jgi:hypothetical protein
MTPTRVSALAFVAVLVGAPLAHAQDAPPPPPPAGAPAPHGWGQGPDGGPARMEARRAERIKRLHDALNIRPDQEAAFAAFTAPHRLDGPGGWKKPGGPKSGDDHAAWASLTTPERLDRMAQMEDARAAHMREALQQRIAATKAFYAVLSAEQKRTFDALPALMGGHRWGGHGGMRPEHGEG